MREESKAGLKEFILVMLWAVLLTLIGDWLRYVMPSYKVLGTVVEILLFCVLAFVVLTRYSAVYTYTADKDIFRANRRIGKRNKEIEIKRGQLKGMVFQRPKNGIKTVNMCRYVFPHKDVKYLLFENSSGIMAVKVSISGKMTKMVSKL